VSEPQRRLSGIPYSREILPDMRAARDELVRIVDESGEDYLYHRDYFVFVDFPLRSGERFSR
jgi:hypothetical protein